jgi:hypothetical protein
VKKVEHWLTESQFVAVFGEPEDEFFVHIAGARHLGPNADPRNDSPYADAAKLRLLDFSVGVRVVPKNRRLTIELVRPTADNARLSWIRFSNVDHGVWGMPSMGCVDLDVQASAELGATTWIDAARVKGRRALLDEQEHQVLIVDGNGNRLATDTIPAGAIKPAGPCYSIGLDLRSRKKTLRLPIQVDASCAGAGVDVAKLNEVLGKSLDQIDPEGSIDPTEWALSIRGVNALKSDLLSLGEKRGAPRGALDSIDALARGGSEQLRQGFRAVVVSELQCIRAGEHYSYRLTSHRTDLEALRRQQSTLAGIDPSLGKSTSTVEVASAHELIESGVTSNLRLLFGKAVVYFADAAVTRTFDEAQTHLLISQPPVTRDRSKRWAVRTRLTQDPAPMGTESTFIEDLTCKSMTAPSSGVLLDELYETTSSESEMSRTVFKLDSRELEPNGYRLKAELLECCSQGNTIEEACGSAKVNSVAERPFIVVNHDFGMWARLLVTTNLTQQREKGFALHAGLNVFPKNTRSYFGGPFLGYAARIIDRDTPPTWNQLGSPESDTGQSTRRTFGWVHHSLLLGVNGSLLYPMTRDATLEVEAAIMADITFTPTGDVPDGARDVLGSTRPGDVAIDLDATAYLGGKVGFRGFAVGGGILLCNIRDLGLRAAHLSGAPLQSIHEGGNLLASVVVTYGGSK